VLTGAAGVVAAGGVLGVTNTLFTQHPDDAIPPEFLPYVLGKRRLTARLAEVAARHSQLRAVDFALAFVTGTRGLDAIMSRAEAEQYVNAMRATTMDGKLTSADEAGRFIYERLHDAPGGVHLGIDGSSVRLAAPSADAPDPDPPPLGPDTATTHRKGRDTMDAERRSKTRPQIMHVLDGAWQGQSVYVAAKLGIADLLAAGARKIDDLAAETGTQAGALGRMLRALASMGIFSIREDGRAELTPLAEPLRSDHPDSVRSFALMVNEELYQSFGGLLDTVRTGEPAFQRHFGVPVFEYFETHPDAAATFHSAMNDWSRWDTPRILEAYDFSRFRTAVDLGGGNGSFLSALLADNPGLSGVLLELPSGIAAASAGLGGPLPRCKLVEGDFLAEVPEGADLYIIKHVLDAWRDEDVLTIFENCRAAMAADSRVVVLESVVEPGNAPSIIKWIDLLMMTVAPGGGFRSEADFSRLLGDAGLRLDLVVQVSETVTLFEGAAT
jgi:hypothetical protein